MNRLGCLSLLLFWAGLVQAQLPPAPVPPPLRQISADQFQIGPVFLDKRRKIVQFPAQINLRDGLIEYLIVNTKGKSYESLFSTEVEPYSIQLAMLLIGARGAPATAAWLAQPSAPFHINATNATPRPAIPGDAIAITVSWPTPNGTNTARVEDGLINRGKRAKVSKGPWTFNGSRVVHGNFMAQDEGSIAAMIDDIDAMVNNPRPGSDNDQIWEIATNFWPPLHSAVTLTFHLEDIKK